MPADLRDDQENRLQNDSARRPLPPRSIMPQHGGNSHTTTTTTEGSSNINNRDGGGAARNTVDGARTDVSNTRRLVKRYRVEVAASASSVLSTLTTFPLDSVKTRMQTYKYAGFLDCVRHTYQTEKMRGFFRGVTAPMASITLVRTVSFSIYQRSKYSYCDWVKKNFGVDVMSHVSARGSYPNFWSVATFGAAGATAGSCITLIACPFELTKLSAQVSVLMADKKNCPKPESHAIAASYQNKGTLKTFGNIIKHRGFMGLYTGFRLHLLRDTLGTGTYFMTYESSKQLLTTLGGDGTHSNPLAVLVAGGLCGIVSWALIYPVDSAKSIYQRNSLMYSKGQTVEPVKIAFFQRNMYRGLGVSMGRSCAVNAVFFSSFEFLKKRIKAMDEHSHTSGGGSGRDKLLQ
ncbi:mitochondrial carrier domain-containing protein [Apodospora peruviana]|uniref:Mitochondrial carrier domain-containing protein n=1 Tax=Apodospora peruviana TaxID=516989 RepID=A0AAE0HY43_9PEZI|nr:mitochondrial carrier domain-containing protein [Apodospora peruviana]